MTFFHSLSAAGFAATAISYGPARMGFGLFVPEFKSTFAMSSQMVGLVSSLGFAGFFIGLLVAQFLLDRKGPQAPILAGMAAATIGLGGVALAPGPGVLAAGVFLAASSAGFSWTPFNDAVHRKVRGVDRSTALSEISTGTSVGIILAGAVTLIMVLEGFDWRICWAIFAAAAALTLVGNWAALRQVDKAPDAGAQDRWRDLLDFAAAPLYGIAFVFGITSAVYISFAADRFAQQGLPGMPEGSEPSLVFIFYGFFGLAGVLTNRARDRIGLPQLLRLLLLAGAASLILAGLLTGSWIGLVLSAGLQGVNVMMTSAILAFWSERLFPAFPSRGFTTALLATAAGSVIGPALAGLAAGFAGPAVMFCSTAILPVAAAAVLKTRFVVEYPAGRPVE